MAYCTNSLCWGYIPCAHHCESNVQASSSSRKFSDLGRAALFDKEETLLRENAQNSTKKPAVMFVCIHNAGRSQMAQGFLQHYLGDRAVVCSSGSQPGDKVNEVAVIAMKEKGIDISSAYPKPLDSSRFGYLDKAVTMGCGDVCPLVPNVTVEDWKLEDPRGADLETVRKIRDSIEERVLALCRELVPGFS